MIKIVAKAVRVISQHWEKRAHLQRHFASTYQWNSGLREPPQLFLESNWASSEVEDFRDALQSAFVSLKGDWEYEEWDTHRT